MAAPDFAALEQKYGLPPGLLAAQQQVESGGRDVTSPKGAQGPAQLMPATSRTYHVNPHDPAQAAEAQAHIMRQNIDASGGDLDRAAMMYHGGADTSQWGPLTHAYPGKIAAVLQSHNAPPSQPAAPTADPNDPVEAAYAARAPQSDANDPVEAAYQASIKGGNAAPNSNVPGNPGNQGSPGDNLDGGGVNPPRSAQGAPGAGQGAAGNQGTNPGASPGTAGPGGDQSGGTGLADYIRGIPEGWGDLQTDIVKLGARGTDALGITNGELARLDAAEKALKGGTVDPTYDDPNGWGRFLGRFTGEAAAGAPITEIKPLEALGVGGKLARGLDLMAQGGAFGTVASGGHNIARNAALGAALAPVAGKVLEPVFRGAGWGIQKLANGAESLNAKMSDALRARMAGDMTPATSDFTADPAFIGDQIARNGAAGHPGPLSPAEMAQAQAENPDSLMVDVTADNPAAPPVTVTPQQMGAAIGNRAAKRGIESTNDLPAAVGARYQELIDQGVPEAEALRQADIEGVGAKPTVATTTRTPDDMRAMYEGAKAGTPEGDQLSAMIADNGAALHQHVQGMVQDLGGVPAEGSAAQEAAQALAQASDAAKAKVSQAYAAARAADGDQRVSIDGLRELLAKPEYQPGAATTPEGNAMTSGLRTQIAAMSKENGGRFSPEEIDQLTKAANAAYNPMGGGANHMVGEVKNALGESLDQFDNAGPAFKAARAAHREWAQQYDDPQGIARLIQRDAQGNFVKDDSWRAAENIVGSKDDKSFIQIVNQLQKNGSTDELNRLKATVVQRAYEKAAQGASDRAGNQTINGNRWFTELNKIGLPKLNALFSPAELADLAHVGRASIHLNEAVPGAVNTSNTASAVLDALGRQGKGAPRSVQIGGRLLGHSLAAGTHGLGNIAVEGLMHGADRAVQGRAAAKLGDAITQMMDPAAARTAANENAISAAERTRRAALANTLAKRIAPAITADRRGN